MITVNCYQTPCLKLINGMFAFKVVNIVNKELMLLYFPVLEYITKRLVYAFYLLDNRGLK